MLFATVVWQLYLFNLPQRKGDHRNALCLSDHQSVCPSVCPSVITLYVCSISPLPLEGFSFNLGLILTQPCGFKVKVTIEGYRFEPCISCPLHISFTPGRIFIKVWSNVHLRQTVCGTHNSTMLTQGLGHS